MIEFVFLMNTDNAHIATSATGSYRALYYSPSPYAAAGAPLITSSAVGKGWLAKISLAESDIQRVSKICPTITFNLTMSDDSVHRLTFYVNGKLYEVAPADPRSTLLQFLRQNRLTGTKLGCGEGG